MAEESGDNFSDEASNKELLEKAKNEFNREKRLVVKNLPASTTEKEIRAFMGFNGEFPVEDVSMIKQNNQAIVTLKDASVVDEAISKLNNTELNGLVVSVVKYHSDKILCVAHLPTTLTEYQFRELAAQYGNLEKCFLMRSEETGESKGYGFVEYNESIETVGKIKCKLDGSDVKGHQVHCDALTDSSQTGIRFQDLHSRCLLINNLPKDYKDSIELRELFSTLVKPVYCQIVAKEGESLGFGIIEYNEWEDAEKAHKKFNKHKINDVEINVSFCIPGKSAVHMFTRIMFKYGDTVQVNKASLLPDPVYPNPAFLKHVFFKTHLEKHPRLLVLFTDNLLHLQEGYVKQLEGRTNTKPGLLGPAPSIPMNPLMDVNLQLGLLSMIVLDMREKGTYSGEIPEPLGKVKIPTEEEFQQKAEPVSLLGDPLTAQANIILRNILMPEPKPEPGLEKVTDDNEPKLLGKAVKSLNLVYLCSLGRIMAMLSDRNQSAGILGNRPNVQSNTGGPKPLIEGLMQAGKVAQTLLNSMGVGQQNNNNMLGNQDLGNLQGLLSNQSSSNSAAANFMNTIQSLALQKLSESKGNGTQLLNALFGNKSSGSGDGLLGEYQGQGNTNQNQSQGGKGPVPLLSINMNNNNNSDGQMSFNRNNDDGNNAGYYGSQGNYDDSGYQGGYDSSDYSDGYGGGVFGRNYGNDRGMRGDNTDMRFGGQMDGQYSNYGNQGQMNMGNRMQGNKGNMNSRGPVDEKDYNSIAQQAAAYAAGAAAAYKQQYEEYMAQHGYRVGYGSVYGDGYQSYSSGNSGYGSSDYGGYDYGSSGGYRSDTYGSSNSGSYSTGMSSGSRSSNTGYSSGGNSNMNSSRLSYNTSSNNSRPGTANSYSSGSNYSSTGSGYGSTGSGYGSTGSAYGSTGSGYGSTGSGYGSSGNSYSTSTSSYGGGNSGYSGSSSNYGNSSSGYGGTSGGYGGWGSSYDGLMNRDPRMGSSSAGGSASGSMGPPMTPGTGKSGLSGGGMNTPQGQKRNSMHILPSPEPSPEGDYIGQHSQGIGGHYADSYVKRQKLAGKF